jgi:hypothetical protein
MRRAMNYFQNWETHCQKKKWASWRAVPTPKLLIKNHKPMNKKGKYVMQLIVPATNFTAAFPNIGLLWIYYHPSVSIKNDTREIEYHKG